MFHSWGFLHFMLGLPLGSTYVLRRRFKPEGALQAVSEHETDALAVVPVMLQRIMELPDETRSKYDLSSLRVTAASGSALPGELATRWMDSFGDNLYNLYGSTEVAWASIATPEDMREAPGTAGQPPHGTVVRIVDEDGKDVPSGETGRIFVGNEMAFSGYTGGGGKDDLDGLMSSGRRRPLRRKGPPLHRRPRRRDDRLRRRERLPARGRGPALRPRRDRRGGRDRRRRREVRPAAEGVRRPRPPGKKLSEDEVKAHIKSNLARYKVPREVEFMDELPRNPTGKVLKRELS